MIEVVPSFPAGQGTRLHLRPPRALTARQFVALFAALAGAMWGVALLAWWAGNAFAPAFALLHSVMVAVALRVTWNRGERSEDIRIGPDAVEVRREPGPHPVFRAHPYWVRLCRGDGGESIWLSCMGRRIEVGSLLGPAERQELAGKLQDLLAAASGRNR